jgi:hypothetical protein
MKKSAIKSSPRRSALAPYTPSHEETSAKAQELWHRLGRPEGRDNEIWFAAERALSKKSPAFNGTELNDELDALFPDTDRGEPTAL